MRDALNADYQSNRRQCGFIGTRLVYPLKCKEQLKASITDEAPPDVVKLRGRQIG